MAWAATLAIKAGSSTGAEHQLVIQIHSVARLAGVRIISPLQPAFRNLSIEPLYQVVGITTIKVIRCCESGGEANSLADGGGIQRQCRSSL
jgi:hypothetical protein